MINLDPAVLSQVVKPARYTGNEWNSVTKNPAAVEAAVALALPDVYEVGMSNLGLKILYQILNDRPDTAAERVFAPWTDMESQMRARSLPLFTLESKRPVSEFDLLGFSLQYEMINTNVLNMLDLAGIPIFAADRRPGQPFVIGGGPCVYNAEPVAEFFDLFVLGEGEEVLPEVVEALIAWKRTGGAGGRTGFLKQAALIAGVYVPAFYDVAYAADGAFAGIAPNCPEASPVITKRLVKDLDAVPTATKPVVPFIDIVHDRLMLELFRGCTRGCRFCQAGVLYRPVRERRPDKLLELAEKLVASTGYSEISLTSLSSADYSGLNDLVGTLLDRFGQRGISISLPSLRIDSFSIELAQKIQAVRKSSLTFAPEAGTQRLRDVINKNVTEQDLATAVGSAFRSGWSAVKLYFMIGLPTETDDDIAGIARLAYRVLDIYREIKGRRGAKVTISVSSFVPKPHTAFQWFGQNSVAEIERKQKLLKSFIRDRNIAYNWHDAKTSQLEGVFSRGDRRLAKVLYAAWQGGAKFDGWSEHFRYDIWQQAFAATGIDPLYYTTRERSFKELLPWRHLSSGVSDKFLQREYEQALAGDKTADCRRHDCSGCGACPALEAAVLDWGPQND